MKIYFTCHKSLLNTKTIEEVLASKLKYREGIFDSAKKCVQSIAQYAVYRNNKEEIKSSYSIYSAEISNIEEVK